MYFVNLYKPVCLLAITFRVLCTQNDDNDVVVIVVETFLIHVELVYK